MFVEVNTKSGKMIINHASVQSIKPFFNEDGEEHGSVLFIDQEYIVTEAYSWLSDLFMGRPCKFPYQSA